MATKSTTAKKIVRVAGKTVTTVAEGKELLTKYHAKMKPVGEKGKPGGYDSLDEFLYTYLVPMALNRLAALDRYNDKVSK